MEILLILVSEICSGEVVETLQLGAFDKNRSSLERSEVEYELASVLLPHAVNHPPLGHIDTTRLTALNCGCCQQIQCIYPESGSGSSP